MAKEIVAMILAGGRGSRLYALIQKTAKPAVSFGGKYRIVDFPLSNCVNSNIDTVGIATQYQPQKLNEYIGNGQPWDLDRLYGGVHTLPPYEQAKGTDWYKGTANAIYQNISFIDSYDPEYVIILSGDQICKQDYADFLRFHKEKGAEFSVAVMEVDWKEASRFGLMVADEDDRITEFQEKPPVPKSNLASMGIYIFNWDILKKYLEEDEADPKDGKYDRIEVGKVQCGQFRRHDPRVGCPADFQYQLHDFICEIGQQDKQHGADCQFYRVFCLYACYKAVVLE